MKKFYILSLLFSFVSILAQTNLKKADALFKNYSYTDAAKAYEECLQKIDKPSVQTLKNAADSYYFISDNRNALKWYQKLYEVQGDNLSDIYYLRYIQSMKGVMDYDNADKVTKEYLNKKGDQKEIDRYIYQKKLLDSLSKAKSLYTLKNIAINTDKSDFGATFYGDKVVFTSARDTGNFDKKLYNWNKQPFLNLYVAERSAIDGSLFNEVLFIPNVMSKYHEATVTFSPDWKTMYYTTNILKKNKLVIDESRTNNFQIIKGTIEDNKLVKTEKVFFDSDKYSVGHPYLSDDGKMLFFASDMPGGYGETDLYVVKIADDGTMSSPQNLGPTINTLGNDVFPSYRNGVLYFSSDGHYGLGDLDVYESKLSGELNFSAPRNLGAPINSNKDDFSFVIDPKENYGYVSSNRAQGKGDDDIYYFTKGKPICNQLVSGQAINTKTKKGLSDTFIIAYDVYDAVITETKTDADGNYKLEVPCNKRIKMTANKPNFSGDEKFIETTKDNNAEIKDVNFYLSNYDDLVVKKDGVEKVDINPIFFDYDKSNINPQAAAELDKVVFVMQKFPKIKIKIESHTDSRGKDAYNMKLSDARAKSTQTYILSKGIEASRIASAIGYGESRLVNKCSNGVKCTEQEHLANRRSDFIVIEK
ncbi:MULTISPECIES: OmpA family protein [unclassified Flavobacterium]|jgi:outer membrane protein OmpA-like peptidoglycan-associated protein|uniref:OmpA family protein n=1 Tax=unclassified Flavobacterium TaxID=196869 RepID=UPI00057EE630|nr:MULTISPECIES: OmpA family protein [unclassified Flavobacterium]KIA98482.1 flagellar motor protein MotB [Flavobacterium sp. KMS]MEA9412293.1 OmpA family protein [Flavobacterium sp. PL02]OUL60143.1 flagellar motor protein MotB [Flavobacterium sp. AJR]